MPNMQVAHVIWSENKVLGHLWKHVAVFSWPPSLGALQKSNRGSPSLAKCLGLCRMRYTDVGGHTPCPFSDLGGTEATAVTFCCRKSISWRAGAWVSHLALRGSGLFTLSFWRALEPPSLAHTLQALLFAVWVPCLFHKVSLWVEGRFQASFQNVLWSTSFSFSVVL